MSPPRPWATMARAAAWATRKLPLAMTSCCTSQSSALVSSSPLEIDKPALLTTRSIPPKATTVAATACCTAASSVTSAGTARATSLPPKAEATSPAPCASRSATTTQAPSAASCAAMARPMGQLGLLQSPVLDAELLRLGNGAVGGDGLGPAHHVDGVDIELTGDPGGLLVRAEGEHPHSGYQHDGGIGPSHARRAGLG